jgi:hypothetical protein
VLTAFIVLAFALRRRDDPWWRADAVVLLLPTVTILGVVAWGSWEVYAASNQLVGIQGRYLYPGVVGVAALVALGGGASLRGWARGLPLVLLAVAGALQYAAARTGLAARPPAARVAACFFRVRAL